MKEHAVDEALSIVWVQVEQHYAVISVAIPCLRPVVNHLITHYGALGPENSAHKSSGYSKDITATDGIELSANPKTLSRPFGFRKSAEPRHGIPGQAYSHGIIEHQAKVDAGMTDHNVLDPQRPSGDSGDSQRMIIRKHVSWTVQREDR